MYKGEKRMKKTLGINSDVFLRVLAFHGYRYAIATSKEKFEPDENVEIARVSVANFSKYRWEVQNDQLSYEVNENQLRFYSNEWNKGMNLAMWRECEEQDEIEIQIEKQIYSSARSNITIFITEASQEDMLDYESNGISLVNYKGAGIYRRIRMQEEILCRDVGQTVTMKIVKNDKKIHIEYERLDGSKECVPLLQLADDFDIPLRIGFVIHMGNNIYYEWLLGNYINLYGDHTNYYYVKADFLCNQHRNYSLYTYDCVFEYQRVTEKEIDTLGIEFNHYVKRQIDLGRYVEVIVNDKIHKGITDENQKDNHQDLIYGYDDEQKVYELLYYDLGRIRKATLSYELFEFARRKTLDNKISVISYSPREEGYAFDLDSVLRQYKEYRDGTNTLFYEPNLSQRCYFGMKYLDFLCTKEGIKEYVSDIRISYLFIEHAKLSMQRMKYLYDNQFLEEAIYQELIRLLNEKITYLNKQKNVIGKYVLTNVINEEKIRGFMEQVRGIENQFLNLLIKTLDAKAK